MLCLPPVMDLIVKMVRGYEVRRVCKFAKMRFDERLDARLSFRQGGGWDIDDVERLVCHTPNLAHLDVAGSPDWPWGSIEILWRCIALKTLRVDDCSHMYSLDALSSLASLQRIELQDQRSSDLSPLAGLTSLTFLKLSGRRLGRVLDLEPLASCTALQYLEIDHPRATYLNGLTPLGALTRLETLRLSGKAIRNLEPLAQLVLLRDLAVRGCRQASLAPLAVLTLLQRLDVEGECVTDLTALVACTDIRHMRLARCNLELVEHHESDIEIATRRWRSLRTLEIGCDEQLWTLKDLWPCSIGLEHIYLSGNLYIYELCGRMDMLRTLDLSDCVDVYDLDPLVSFTSLEDLSIKNCKKVDSLYALVDCTMLRRLDISGCTQVSDIKPLGTCVELEHIHMAGCRSVTDVSPLGNCTRMKFLDITGCFQVHDLSKLIGCMDLRIKT